MTTPVATRLLTAEEFYCLPDSPEGGKMELLRGEVVRHMPVGGPHGHHVIVLGTEFTLFNRRQRVGDFGGEVGFILARNPDVVRAPDVHFVRRERLPLGTMPPGFFDGAPDLAVEVVSPGDTDQEVAAKLADYALGGTPRVWVVRPLLKTITVHRADGTARTYGPGDRLDSDAAGFSVDGFELDLDAFFAE